jgi:hypothetical protein
VIIGWLVMGKGTGQGTPHAMAAGLRTSGLLLFWGMFVFSIQEMLTRSMDLRYDGIQKALEGTVDILIEYGALVFGSGTTIAVLIVGGVLGGVFANWAAVRWN